MSVGESLANPTYAYVRTFIDELSRSGVRHVVICPGSRSTPLAMALAEQHSMRMWMHVDERSAAFFALGMAKRLGETVALLCTSGTAAANFFPAIIEAKLTHIPLLVLTADRPHELRDCGAPQSIDQDRLYGTYVKWFVDVALPEATNTALRYVRTLANRAVALAQAVPAGSVHLNFPFREPLTPGPSADLPLPSPAQRDSTAWYGRSDHTPYVTVHDSSLAGPSPATLAQLAASMRARRHGLIIVGPQDDTALIEPLTQLARHLGYPILADPLSQLRCGDHGQTHVLSSYDAFLRIESFVERIVPDFILRFGAMPTSKPVLLYLKRYSSCPLVVLDKHGGWEEPTQLAADLIHADPVALCRDVIGQIQPSDDAALSAWLTTWQQADRVTRQAILHSMQDYAELFEGRIFTELAELLPDGATLYVGNSMPVRDLDTFFWNTTRHIRVLGNRGANGIDGVVSSALGASAAAGDATVLVVGDLSFYHDLNGLLAAKMHGLNLTIVLVNNDGGGIFSFLPQADYPEHFEQLFGTPTGLDFHSAVQMYGGQFQRITSWEQFRKVVSKGLSYEGLHVVEVPTQRDSNVALHRQLWQAVSKAIDGQVSAQQATIGGK
ncbi:MAG: 2-succinyl-5-enolpyruvyl-6-hydroxy-3-cyclohexene-1-carboxylic-acid synthase [Ktedonobacteraceae bacterium]|nr:2-succinyl-5-enolpyruvyl-6-hydroxy-3-cyclohexene-1-carboxylic-acid synthase [Ktedonobacteraceae bacterium]